MAERRRSDRLLRLKNETDGRQGGGEINKKKRKSSSSGVEGRRRSKRLQLVNGGGDSGDLWKNLHPDILARILVNIPPETIVKTVPLVCKSWSEAVAGPYCWWNGIDLEPWCFRKVGKIKLKNDAVRSLLSRCDNNCNSFTAHWLGKQGCSFLLKSAKRLCLKALKIPGCQLTDKMVNKHAQSLKMLTVLDISYCKDITHHGLEVLGSSCPFLTDLKRNLVKLGYEEEAMVIAKTMQGLERLSLRGGSFTDIGLRAILTNCKKLTHLDIEWCPYVKLEGDLKDMCLQLIEFTHSKTLT